MSTHLNPVYKQIAHKYARKKFRDYGLFSLSIKKISSAMEKTKLGTKDIEIFETSVPGLMAVLAHSKEGETFLNKLRVSIPDETKELMETDFY